jgi:hypothetical protein
MGVQEEKQQQAVVDAVMKEFFPRLFLHTCIVGKLGGAVA